jgi:hypothetical protein
VSITEAKSLEIRSIAKPASADYAEPVPTQ